ncbi:MAG: T9SS type A sorting domain-containing protein [Bacteroidota bacterium]
MKTINTIIACLLLSTMLKSQNLVPNGSFEQYDTCVTSDCQIYRALGWSNYIGDVEYYDSCANTNHPLFGVPQNEFGNQNAEDGYGYSSLQFYQWNTPNGSEVFGRQLSQSLDTSQKYYCSFYVVRVKIGQPLIEINNIGIKFSTIDYGCPWCCIAPPKPFLINNTAAVYSNNIIYDSVNWVQISGWYKPDSAYNYIMIGNFFDAAHTNYFPTDTGFAYYYIDNIYVGLDSVSNYHEGVPDINSISNKINIYPNPATATVTISSSNDAIENLELYSMVGRLIYAESVERKNEVNISVADIKQGIYLIKILTTKNNQVQKIQIIH